jgi:hypothetical protein
MSSLRLALKQSLQETGHLAPDGDKKRKKGRRNSIDSIRNRRGRRPGEPPRGNSHKRGRPRHIPTSPDDREGGGGDASNINSDEGKERDRLSATGERQSSARHQDDCSSSENEFSYEDDEEDESHADGGDDDDEEGGGGDRGHDDEEDDDDEEEDDEDEDDDMHSDEEDHEDGRNHTADVDRPRLVTTDSGLAVAGTAASTSEGLTTNDRAGTTTTGSLQSSSLRELQQGPKSKSVKTQAPEDTTSDDEQRKNRRLLKKKLKHSAAHKIQNQWKKKKLDSNNGGRISQQEGASPSSPISVSPADRGSQESNLATVASAKEASPPTRISRGVNDKDDDDTTDEPDETVVKKKKKKADGVVPAPTADVLEWTRAMSEKKCRKNVATGLRVKVRVANQALHFSEVCP